MTSADRTVIAFDLYGTLLSTESIAKELATHCKCGHEKAQEIAALWRRYQLEYTWRLNSMSLYKDFSTITNLSLKHDLVESSVTLTAKAVASLMHAYDSLGTFPDVPPALEALQSSLTIDAYIFSNGTNSMVSTSVKSSPPISPYHAVFKDLITVEEVQAYKPDLRTYQHLAQKVGKDCKDKQDLGSIWLVSGNPFDIVGARSAGFQAAWVDRIGKGWCDRLGDAAGGGPTIVVGGVEQAVRGIEKWVEDRGKEKQKGN
ncbi:HAD-like protein [Venustampulla echinocandica]|uniref:HAD-like protein n=1 Tax=Venustampulla echinocandica TaxID=2656787 RepID=A0A370TDN1_9HELO|nr:HAD-like protein [Venustampulla echinocandica]RDL32557.1 HAD-like protein [Venustampulla echinocandica]